MLKENALQSTPSSHALQQPWLPSMLQEGNRRRPIAFEYLPSFPKQAVPEGFSVAMSLTAGRLVNSL